MSYPKPDNKTTQFNFLVDAHDKQVLIRIAGLMGMEIKEFMGQEIKEIIHKYQDTLKIGEQLKTQSNAT